MKKTLPTSRGLIQFRKKTVYTEKQIQNMVAGFAYKGIVDITMPKGIPIQLVLPYDVSQEQYLFDEDGFMVWIGKNLVESPTPPLTHD